MRSTLTFLLLGATLTLAAERKQPDIQVGHNTIKARTLPGASLFLRQYESCDIGYTECGPACMLISSECCVGSGGMGSCPIGYYCDGTGAEAGCCERGKICSGLSGECTDRSKRCGDGCIPESETCDESTSPTPTGTSSGSSPTSTSSGGTTSGSGSVLSCDVGEVECDTGCMPVGGQCCSDSGLGNYCEAGYICVGSARCRRGSGTNFTSSRTTSSSSATSTTTPSRTTATPMPTNGGASSPSLPPSGGDSSQAPEASDGAASGVYVPGALVGVALLGGVFVAMGF